MAIWKFLYGRKAKLQRTVSSFFQFTMVLQTSSCPFSYSYLSHKDIILLIPPREFFLFFIKKDTLELPYINTWCLSGTVGENGHSTLIQEYVSVTQMTVLKKNLCSRINELN